MLTPIVGLGVSVQGTAHQEVPGLSIRIPHPLFFGAFASDTTLGNRALTRAEGSMHIDAMFVATQNSDRIRLLPVCWRFYSGRAVDVGGRCSIAIPRNG